MGLLHFHCCWGRSLVVLVVVPLLLGVVGAGGCCIGATRFSLRQQHTIMLTTMLTRRARPKMLPTAPPTASTGQFTL